MVPKPERSAPSRQKSAGRWAGQLLHGTHTGEQALDRDFGIDISTTDYPQESAQALLAAEYVRKTKMYEPRARVVRVEWTDSKAHDGNITPKVVIDLV